ncbi:MAG: radical SAM protein [Candidatus Cloacimonetes bacterium]|nr:radical SAM protein [Candidatus Cloacimonadota bacterium]
MPINYTFSLLYTCNSRCRTCNIYKKKADNLTPEEYRKIFQNIGHSPYWITISGGEPFLRTDLAVICQDMYEYCRPKIINIPTNGILTDKIVTTVKKIIASCPKTHLIINISIDGIEKQHDEIRQVPGNYQKAVQTLHRLKKLEANNLSVGIHTVISRFNVKQFATIANSLMAMKPDSYITEIAEHRVELDTMKEDITPDLLEYSSAIDYLIHRLKNGKFKGMNKITQAFRIEYYNNVKKILRDNTQIIDCYSGIASVHIAPDGDIWSCCIKAAPLGNLRKTDYDIRKIWCSPEMKTERKSIRNKECFCPLANAAYTNMLMDFRTLLKVFYHSFIKWWT